MQILERWLDYLDTHTTLVWLWGYWVPLAVNALYATLEIIRLYRKELATRSGDSVYAPTLTTGTLAGYVCLIVIPVINFFYGTFNALPKLASRYLLSWWEQFFNIPLVPDSHYHQDLRTKKHEAEWEARRRGGKEKAVRVSGIQLED